MERMTEDEATLGLLGISMGLLAIGLLLMQTGCASHAPAPWQEGSVMLAADEKGMRAFGDMMVGVANEVRTPSGMKSSAYQLREQQEAQRTQREIAPGWWGKLFGGGAK